MQDSSTQHLVIGAEPGQNRRDLHRVGDVRFAAVADLALMTTRRDIVGPPKQLDIGIRTGRSHGHTQSCKEIPFRPFALR
jgi:hypothetical protein